MNIVRLFLYSDPKNKKKSKVKGRSSRIIWLFSKPNIFPLFDRSQLAFSANFIQKLGIVCNIAVNWGKK